MQMNGSTAVRVLSLTGIGGSTEATTALLESSVAIQSQDTHLGNRISSRLESTSCILGSPMTHQAAFVSPMRLVLICLFQQA